MEIIAPLAVILVVVLYLLVKGGTRLADMDAFHDQIIEKESKMFRIVNFDFDERIASLRRAIQNNNGEEILRLYDEINMMDFTMISGVLLDEYDELVEMGNDILYEQKA